MFIIKKNIYILEVDLLYALQVGEQAKLHVVVQDPRANDDIGKADSDIQLLSETKTGFKNTHWRWRVR